MKFCLYETRKQLTGRLMWGILALMLLLNMVFCYQYASSRPRLDILPAMKAADEVVRQTPDGLPADFRLYQAEYEAYEREFEEWLLSSGGETMTPPPEAPEIPSTYFEGWDDYALIQAYLDQVLSDEEYRETINTDIDDAVRSLKNYRANGYDPDSYAYRYLLRYIEVYNRTLERVQVKEGYVYGWDILFSYSGTGLVIFLAALFIGGRLFLIERESGMHLLLRTARYGRGRQAAAKLFSALLLSVLITILFTLSSMAVIEWRVGFSSPFGSVQQIQAMLHCPYSLNMLTCLLLTVGVTVLAAYAICLLTACCSLLLRRSFGAMMITAVLVGLSYYLANQKNLHFVKYVNIFTATSAETLLGQWRAVHVGSHPVSQLIPLAVLLGFILLLSAAVGWFVWCKWGIGVSSSKTGRLSQEAAKLVEKLPRLKRCSLSIFACEQKKLFPPKLTLICVLLIGLKIILSVSTFNGELTYTDDIKLLYMAQYEEMTLEESYEAVTERLDYYNEITAEEYIGDMAAKRLNGELTAQEYSEYRNQLSEARSYQKTLSSFAGELEYLLEKEAETGISTKPVFSAGFRKLLDSDFEEILVIIFAVLFCGSYAREYESGFMPLLRSTKRGRKRVFMAKAVGIIGVSVILSLAFSLIDMGLIFAHYDMTCVSSPLFAVRIYSQTSSGLTIGNYLILLTGLRVLTYTLFGLMIGALSGCLCSEWSAAGVTLLFFIPYLLCGLGLTVFQAIDVTAALSVDRLYLYSAAIGNAGSLWFFGVFIAIWCAVIAALGIAAYRKFCK